MDKPLNIIFEDKYLLAVNKPAGLLVIPTPKMEKHTLTNIVKDIMANRGLARAIYPCHRLDRDTSGIILFAKTREIEKEMYLQFKERTIRKKYVALIKGAPKLSHGTIKKRIEGKEAVTEYKLLEKRRDYSILEVRPITGRTNQIRIHLKVIGHPVLGERKFAFGKDFKVKFRRTALHARELSFKHPVTGKLIELKAAIPDDMKKLM